MSSVSLIVEMLQKRICDIVCTQYSIWSRTPGAVPLDHAITVWPLLAVLRRLSGRATARAETKNGRALDAGVGLWT